ncbi:MAG: hypothetical protein JST86_19925 [Bacteroidetes bacterium]|nr:hypothetical protein [Bacteroidota bacterium]
MKTTPCFILFCCVFFLVKSVHSQSLRNAVSAPYPGLTAYSVNQVDALSFTANQAALAFVPHASLGVYGEQRYLLNGLNTYTATAAMLTRLGNIGININYSGLKNFNEMQAGIAYARKLGSNVALGVQFNYYTYRIPGYYSAFTVNAEGGILVKLADQLYGGVHIYNPVPSALKNTEDEKLAKRFSAGFGYDASDNFYAVIELLKEENKTVTVVAGFQYHFSKRFFMRAGLTTATSSPFFGAGLYWKRLRIDVAAGYHPQLGVSPATMMLADFGKIHE